MRELRDCQRRLTAAAGNTPAAAVPSLTDQSVAGITAAAQEVLAALTQGQGELSRLAVARSVAQAELAAAKEQIERAAAERARAQAERAAERSRRRGKAMGSAKRKLFRVAAAGIVVLMLYILSVY